MRRELQKALPALSEFCHLKPWDVERLTRFEVMEYLDYTYQRRQEVQGRT